MLRAIGARSLNSRCNSSHRATTDDDDDEEEEEESDEEEVDELTGCVVMLACAKVLDKTFELGREPMDVDREESD